MGERIQLSRSKGYRKPAGAVVVARPSRWGNPFVVGPERDAAEAVAMFRAWLTDPAEPPCDLSELKGRDLACWCPLEDGSGLRAPCHADVLLALANPEVTFPWSK